MECFQSKRLGVVDQDVEKLAKYRRSKTARTRGHNCSRDFHRWVHRDQRAFDVKISTLKVPIRIKHKRRNGRQIIGVKKVDYPVIHLSSWFEKLINTFPQFFLGGFDLYQQEESWAGMLSNFWKNFLGVDPQHPVHLKTDAEKKDVFQSPYMEMRDGDWQKFPWWYGRFKWSSPAVVRTIWIPHSNLPPLNLFDVFLIFSYMVMVLCLVVFMSLAFTEAFIFYTVALLIDPLFKLCTGVLYHRCFFQRNGHRLCQNVWWWNFFWGALAQD